MAYNKVRGSTSAALLDLDAIHGGQGIGYSAPQTFSTAGILSGLAAMLAGSGRNRAWYDRAPGAVLGATLALFAAIPAGRWVQRNVTTSSHVDGLRIAAVERLATAPVIRHRVTIA